MEELVFLVPWRTLVQDQCGPKYFKNYEINNKDKQILRELAREKAEIASLSVHKEKIGMWKKLNSLQEVRPLVWMCDFPWHELNVNNELTNKTTTDFSRFLENRLRMTIYQWNHMRGDMVVEPTLQCNLIISEIDFGMAEKTAKIKMDENSDIISRNYIPQIKTEDDIKKIKNPKVIYDKKSTQEMFQSMQDIFEGILTVEKKGIPGWYFSIWDNLIMWYGVEEALADLIIRPDFVHKVLNRLTEANLAMLDEYEKQNLLALNNSNYRVGSSGLSFTDELPQKEFNPNQIKANDMWGCATAQIFSAVSPEMHDEFALQYEIRYMKRFGLNYYGCCEPLHKKIDIIKKIPRLRKISMSSWSNLEEGAEKIGKEFVFSWKPSSAIFTNENWDRDSIRKELRENLNKIKNCKIEIVMKDISTVRYKPQRLWEWAKIASEEVERLN